MSLTGFGVSRNPAASLKMTTRGATSPPLEPASPGPLAGEPSQSGDTLGLMTDEALIAEATSRLAAAAPEAKVILFGSRARGEGRSGSDLDLLVIEPELKNRRAEFVRLRQALGDLGVPIDLIVLSAEYADQRAEVRGSMVNEALQRGRVLVGA